MINTRAPDGANKSEVKYTEYIGADFDYAPPLITKGSKLS